MTEVQKYLDHGWKLTAIPHGSKAPNTLKWQHKENALRSYEELPDNSGVGLLHAYSGTMAFDIDDYEKSVELLAEEGIDLNELCSAPDAVLIWSGKEGHAKLLYKMPFGLTLPSKQVAIKDVNGSKTAIYDFRCGTNNGLSKQDVLPPSVHPDTGNPYQWVGTGHWSKLPFIPVSLLSHWKSLLVEPVKQEETPKPVRGTNWDEIESAIAAISPDIDRKEWINIGCALHDYGTKTDTLSNAFVVWDKWSSPSGKYPGDRELTTQWNSFGSNKPSVITIGTLFQMAIDAGWVRPPVDAASLFSAITPVHPIDVHIGLKPLPVDIDLSLFPPVLARRSQEVSDSVGCDPLVPLWAGLGAICGVVDAQTRLQLVEGFNVPPILWLMTIGEPGDKKSPGSKPMMTVLKDIEIENRPQFKKELLDWEGKEAAYAVAKKSYLEFAASPDALLDSSAAPFVPDLPPQPCPLRITVNDITSQKLVRNAADRPRGLLCALDEMNSWVRKLTDRSSGEDRSAWVVSYESDRYEMDRVGAGVIHCENLAVSIFGNIQPRIFRQHLSALSSDGLIQRFIPAVLRFNQTRIGNPIPDHLTNRDKWDQTLRTTFALPPMKYKLTTEAFRSFRAFQEWYEKAKQDERLIQSCDTYMTAFGKLEGTLGRLVLIFHIIEKPFSEFIDHHIVDKVVKLVREYIIPSIRHTFSELGEESSFDAWLIDNIINHCDKETITVSEIRRSARRRLEGQSVWQAESMIMMGMQILEDTGWVIRAEETTTRLKQKATWIINPNLITQFSEYRTRVRAAKQRVKENVSLGKVKVDTE